MLFAGTFFADLGKKRFEINRANDKEILDGMLDVL